MISAELGRSKLGTDATNPHFLPQFMGSEKVGPRPRNYMKINFSGLLAGIETFVCVGNASKKAIAEIAKKVPTAAQETFGDVTLLMCLPNTNNSKQVSQILHKYGDLEEPNNRLHGEALIVEAFRKLNNQPLVANDKGTQDLIQRLTAIARTIAPQFSDEILVQLITADLYSPSPTVQFLQANAETNTFSQAMLASGAGLNSEGPVGELTERLGINLPEKTSDQ